VLKEKSKSFKETYDLLKSGFRKEEIAQSQAELISSKARTQTQAIQMAVTTLLPSIFPSGYIFPRFTMPDVFYALSFLIPATYYMNILRGIILRGAGVVDLAQDIIILSSIGIALSNAS